MAITQEERNNFAACLKGVMQCEAQLKNVKNLALLDEPTAMLFSELRFSLGMSKLGILGATLLRLAEDEVPQ